MPSWVIAQPENLALTPEDPLDVSALDVRLTSGRVSVGGTDDPARVEITRVGDARLHVVLDSGLLTVAHDQIKVWPGPLAPLWWWINGGRTYEVDVSVAMPYATACRVWLASGSLVASTVGADVVADCITGFPGMSGEGRWRARASDMLGSGAGVGGGAGWGADLGAVAA